MAIGENAVMYMRINECAPPPREIYFRWSTTPYNDRVFYWGAAVLGGESGGVNMGAIPAAGGWVRVEIPLSTLGLEALHTSG